MEDEKLVPLLGEKVGKILKDNLPFIAIIIMAVALFLASDNLLRLVTETKESLREEVKQYVKSHKVVMVHGRGQDEITIERK